MRRWIHTIALTFIPFSAISEEIYYYSSHPEYYDSEAIKCDNYVRRNADSFKNELATIVNANKNKNWALAKDTYSQYRDILNNKYISEISKCGSNYKFSNDINYYRELFKDTLIFFSKVKSAIAKQTQYKGDMQEDYEFILNYLNIILRSENKTANKSLNQTGANNAPPG